MQINNTTFVVVVLAVIVTKYKIGLLVVFAATHAFARSFASATTHQPNKPNRPECDKFLLQHHKQQQHTGIPTHTHTYTRAICNMQYQRNSNMHNKNKTITTAKQVIANFLFLLLLVFVIIVAALAALLQGETVCF